VKATETCGLRLTLDGLCALACALGHHVVIVEEDGARVADLAEVEDLADLDPTAWVP